MNNDEKILKTLEALQADVKDVKQGQTRLVDGQAHLTTAVEAVAAGQKDQATKADIHRLETKIEKVAKDVKGHTSRIENLEEHTGTPNPHKN